MRGRAGNHYPTATLEQIKDYPLPALEKDAVLLMWRVTALQREALDVMEAWGFTLRAEIIWVKTVKGLVTALPRLRWGAGYATRFAHEVLLVGIKGKPQLTDRKIPSVFFAPRGRHSEKPKEQYLIAERMAPGGPWHELFARTAWPNWRISGNEAPAGLLQYVGK